MAERFEHPSATRPTRRPPSCTPRSAKGALEDAGLGFDDVDAYFCAGDAPGFGAMSMVDYMGLKERPPPWTPPDRRVSYLVHLNQPPGDRGGQGQRWR